LKVNNKTKLGINTPKIKNFMKFELGLIIDSKKEIKGVIIIIEINKTKMIMSGFKKIFLSLNPASKCFIYFKVKVIPI
jgi:hypothetical protein